MYIWLAVLVALAVNACQPGTVPPAMPEAEGARMAAEGVVLSTDRQSYAAGAQSRLTLRNESGEPLGVNLCVSTLERRQGGQWIRSPQQSDQICTMELRILEPGQSVSEMLDLPAALAPGEYRFRTEVERMQTGDRGPQMSNPFQVGS